MLYYTLGEGQVYPNGMLFLDKLECPEQKKTDQN